MEVRNVTLEELHAALAKTNERFGGNITFYDPPSRCNKAGTAWSFRLKPVNSRGPGGRTTAWLGKVRHIAAACWHVHGVFYDSLPDGTPIRARGRRFRAGDEWQDWQAGSQVHPCFASSQCECSNFERVQYKRTSRAMRMRKRIYRFADRCAKALPIDLPGPGDCFDCALKEVETGATLGDHTRSIDHLLLHMAQGYAVPSLVYSALKEVGMEKTYAAAAAFGEIQLADDPEQFMCPTRAETEAIVRTAVIGYMERRIIRGEFPVEPGRA